MDGEAVELTRVTIDLALAGDTTALKLCLDRIMPPVHRLQITVFDPSLMTDEQLDAVLLSASERGLIDLSAVEFKEIEEK
jgi:hypothetical protein